jgi:phosphoglycerol transferase MdoB-like AlkP superfamily enzyme
MLKEKSFMKIISSLLKQFLFWMIFFAITRAIFLIYYSGNVISKHIDFFSAVQVFYYALKLDTSTACYILAFPFFLLVIQSFYSPKLINTINKAYTYFITICYSIICASEIGVYEEWQTKLNYKALLYLKHPKEAFDSSSTLVFLLLILIILVQVFIGYFLYKKYLYQEIINIKRNILFTIVFTIITPILLIIGIRGGLQQIPISQSESYFSKHDILNLSAVNSLWNLYHSYHENAGALSQNQFLFYKYEDAEKLVKQIHKPEKDSTLKILKVGKPNIVLIILESWSADLIESLGGEKGITPRFAGLEKEGILFTNAYASGFRSEQGMGSIFGGFPSTPKVAIIHSPSKFVKLPSLNKYLMNNRYSTSFYFGGQLIYGNIKGYIYSSQFGKITEGKDFGDTVVKGKLGVHDEFVFERQLNELNHEKEPFFSAIFTLSTHSPFDMPMKKAIFWGEKNCTYLNSAYYTDKCIGDFVNKSKKEKWYKNTLFIIVADHSHDTYKDWHTDSPEYHKIPLLFFGDVIKDEYKGMKINTLASQHDIPATSLNQLGIDASGFKWSKNLLNVYCPNFAYYEVPDGVGWIRPWGHFAYEVPINRFTNTQVENSLKDSLIKEGKSYLEVLFREYIDY